MIRAGEWRARDLNPPVSGPACGFLVLCRRAAGLCDDRTQLPVGTLSPQLLGPKRVRILFMETFIMWHKVFM